MSVHSVTCPSCAATLKSAAPLPVGRAIKCPKCAKTFPIPAAAPSTGPASPATVQKLTCPGCNMILKPAKPVPVGKSVKCPKCNRIITVEAEVPKPAPAPVPVEKLKPAPSEPALVSQLRCPECSATLKPAKPVPAGKSIKCPKCASTFPAKAPETEPSQAFKLVEDEPAAPPAPEATEKPELIEDDDAPTKTEEAEETEEGADSGQKHGVNKQALALLAGALMLLAVAVGLLVLALNGFFDPERPAAVSSGPTQTGGPPPTSPGTSPAIVATQPAPPLPVWSANPADVEKLANEVVLGGYGVRGLKEHALREEDHPDGSTTFSFQSREPTPLLPYPPLSFSIRAEPAFMRAASLEKAISEVLKQVTVELRDITATWSAAESGQIDGIPFARVQFSGTFRQKDKVQGFFYLGRDGPSSLSFFGVSAGIEPELMLKQVEAMALTLRKGAGPPRQVDPAEREAVQSIRALKGTVSLFRVNGVLQVVMNGEGINDSHLSPLAGIAGLSRLDLTGARISDAGLEQIKKLANLRELLLNGTPITDAGLAHLSAMNELTVLHLAGTRISDAGLAHLAKLPKLRQVRLDGTKVTDAGVKKLQEAIRGIDVIR